MRLRKLLVGVAILAVVIVWGAMRQRGERELPLITSEEPTQMDAESSAEVVVETPEEAASTVRREAKKKERQASSREHSTPDPRVKKTGIQLQSPEYYLASAEFNPRGIAPDTASLAALRELISDRAGLVDYLSGEAEMIAGKFAGQKLRDGHVSTNTNRRWASDSRNGVYRMLVTNREGKSGRVEILTGEFAPLDVKREDAIRAMDEAESAIANTIAVWGQ